MDVAFAAADVGASMGCDFDADYAGGGFICIVDPGVIGAEDDDARVGDDAGGVVGEVIAGEVGLAIAVDIGGGDVVGENVAGQGDGAVVDLHGGRIAAESYCRRLWNLR